MQESYIKDYIINLLDDTYSDDLERLKALNYGLDDLLNRLSNNLETNKDKYKYNRLTTCYITIKNIIDEEENKNTIPRF